MQISFANLRLCPVSPEHGPAIVLPLQDYQRWLEPHVDLVNEKSLPWEEWAKLEEVEGSLMAVLGYEPSEYYDAGPQAAGHVLVRWVCGPRGFKFPSVAALAEMKELGAPFRLFSSEGKFVLADTINLDAGFLEIGVQAPYLLVRTYEYCPVDDARFIVHILADGK